VTATAEDNEEGRQQALAELEAGLKMHVEQLVWAFDNYVAGDFDKEPETFDRAYVCTW
jgi:hypothetical protein